MMARRPLEDSRSHTSVRTTRSTPAPTGPVSGCWPSPFQACYVIIPTDKRTTPASSVGKSTFHSSSILNHVSSSPVGTGFYTMQIAAGVVADDEHGGEECRRRY